MNKVLLVAYELKNKTKDYSAFFNTLKTAQSWAHYIDTCWLLYTNETPLDWDRKLRPYMDQPDTILITEITRNYQGWLPNEAWQWISQTVGTPAHR